MSSEESPVVVTTGATASTFSVYHRDLPEIRSEGQNPTEAATQLGNELVRALDSALTDYRREALDKAVADVKAFVAQGS